MFKIFRFIMALAFVFGTVGLKAQTLLNAGKLEGNSSNTVHVVKMIQNVNDENIIVGTFTDSLQLNLSGSGYSLMGGNPGIKHSFVARYDAFGSIINGFALGNPNDSVIINSVALDFSDYIYICGSFYGSTPVDFDPSAGVSTLTNSSAGGDGFIAVYDNYGNFMYVLGFETSGIHGSVTDIVLGNSGNIYFCGYFDGTIDANPGAADTLFNATNVDAFIAAFTPAGAFMSFGHLEGSQNEYAMHITRDPGDYLYLAGHFNSDIDMEPFPGTNIKTSNGGNDIFFGKYTGVLNCLAAMNIGSGSNDIAKDLIESNGALMLLAELEGTVDVNPYGGGYLVTSAGMADVAVLRYSLALGFRTAALLGGTADDHATFIEEAYTPMPKGMARGGFGPTHYNVSFNYSSTIDMNPGAGVISVSPVTTPVNAALLRIDTSLNYVSHFTNEALTIAGLALDGNNITNVTIVGDFAGSTDIMPFDGSHVLTHATNNAGYYLYFNRCHMDVIPSILGSHECGTSTVTLHAETTGNEGPVNYFWNNGDYTSYNQTPNDAYEDNVNPYNVNADDAVGCSVSDTIMVYGHTIGSELSATITPVNTTCGNDLGSASASPINAIGSVSYYWSNGDTTSTTDSLLATNYFVQVEDDLCYYQEYFNIGNSDGPVITLDGTYNPACGSVNDGFINITVTGGTAPYSFLWSNGATTEDLTGLGMGSYSLIVTDATGCENQLCADITQPSTINVFQNGIFSPYCTFSGGEIYVGANGGTPPYTYQWDAAAGFQVNDTATGLYAGIYAVTVTDSLGCDTTVNFGIGDADGPYPYVYYSENPSCVGANGLIYTDVFGAGGYTWQWTSGQTTQDISGCPGGKYVCLVTDMFGCKGVMTWELYQQVPVSPTLCMVTVDSTGTQNVVVWDKSANPEADYFKIYREGFCGSDGFTHIGTTLYDSLSVFYDTVVNTETRSWRYYVTCVDTCGFESYPSEINGTIHLTAAFNANFDVELNWEPYLGHSVLRYEIYRENPSETGFDFVDTVPGTTHSYIDTINFSGYSELEYFVDAIPYDDCFASKMGNVRAFNQNSSRSNHARTAILLDTTLLVHNLPGVDDETIKIYPNPANTQVNIKVTGGDGLGYNLEIMDQLGQTVRNISMLNQASFNIQDLNNGVYFIRMRNTNRTVKVVKLIISH